MRATGWFPTAVLLASAQLASAQTSGWNPLPPSLDYRFGDLEIEKNFDEVARETIDPELLEQLLRSCEEQEVTHEDCHSPAFARTFCGQQVLPADVPESRCYEACLEVSPEKACGDDRWFQSICGQAEAERLDRDTVRSIELGRELEWGENESFCYRFRLDVPYRAQAVLAPVTPDGFDCDEDGSPDAICEDVAVIEYRPSDIWMEGLDTHYHGHVLRTFTWAHTLRKEPDRYEWTRDGEFSKSCEEYIWHRYGELSHYEDGAAVHGSDWRRVFETAFGPPDLPSSIGTRSVEGIPLRDWAGRPLPEDLIFPSGLQPKNEFFQVQAVGRNEWYELPIELRQSQIVLDERDPKQARILEKLRIVQREAERWSFRESFAWHLEKSRLAAEAGYIDEQLERADSLKQRWREALLERQAAAAALAQFQARYGNGEVDIERDRSFDPRAWMEQPSIARNLVAMREQRLLHMDELREWQEPRFDQGIDLYRDPEWYWPDDPDLKLEILRTRLEQADRAAVEILAEAEAMGCLEPIEANVCDWSPRMFAERLATIRVMSVREIEFDRCMKYTGNDFSLLDRSRDPTFFRPTINGTTHQVYYDGRPCDAIDYRANPDLVERYFGCYENRQKLILSLFQTEFRGDTRLINSAGKVAPHYRKSDQSVTGNGDFGAEFGYELEWSIADGELMDVCDVNPNAEAEAWIRGRAFGVQKEIFYGRAYASLKSASGAEVKVLGKRIWSKSVTLVDYVNHTWDIVHERYQKQQEFIRATAHIPIGFFKITISGGVAGKVGLDVDLEGRINVQPGSAECVAALLKGTIKPWGSIDAFGEAAASIVVTAVGVKTDLTLIRIDLPYVAQLSVKAIHGDLVLSYDTNADLHLRMLDGRLAVFARVSLGFTKQTWEKTVFKWDGIRMDKTIFASKAELRMNDLLSLRGLL